MRFSAVLSSLGFCSIVIAAAPSEPCVGAANRPGVCLDESKCKSDGGTTISNACPGTPNAIKCCTKPTCGNSAQTLLVNQDGDAAVAGNCRWSSDCAGDSKSGLCPGPSDYKCCQSSEPGIGGYDQPPNFGKNDCKKVAIDGANNIVDQFPGRVRQIYCKREKKPGDSPSDHHNGTATDMMCSDGGGRATMSGEEIAEWVMNHRGTLDLKYVIWGQRIWTTGKDDVKQWGSWRDMEDRKDITQNHWDHVHVSYNS